MSRTIVRRPAVPVEEAELRRIVDEIVLAELELPAELHSELVDDLVELVAAEPSWLDQLAVLVQQRAERRQNEPEP